MPALGPYIDDQQTWEARSALYSDLLAKPDTVPLMASSDGTLIGYGLAHVMAAAETWVADTWRTGERIGEIESVAVLPSHRDRGIGTKLLDELEASLEAIGVTDLILGVVLGNTSARPFTSAVAIDQLGPTCRVSPTTSPHPM
jgi:ribosomal protein S18 acetylase RimI-like enzyme